MGGMELPGFINLVLATMREAGHSAYVVGGCVRDLLRGVEPTDWDIASDATPEQVQALFPESFCENDFGTVTLKPAEGIPEGHKIEITPFRTEFGYSDKRRPDRVEFGVTLEQDLSRRDFTINAIAYDGSTIIDPFDGRKDLNKKIVRAVGNPEERFNEDALRMLRAIRFATVLGFEIEMATKEAIKKLASSISHVSAERIRDELSKMVGAPKKPSHAFHLMHEVGLLKIILPELAEGIGVGQNKHHIYSVFDHNVLSLDFAAEYGYSLAVRWASLCHDIGKPRTKAGDGYNSTFYNHDIVGAKMTRDIMKRLKFSKEFGQKVVTLVRYHLFFYDVGVVTEAAIRRLVKKVGKENIEDLLKVRVAERMGSGVAKAKPYRLRHLEFMIEKVARDPISVKMLKIDGAALMNTIGMQPGPRMGWILNALLEEVIEDPSRNTEEHLLGRARELNSMNDSELAELASKAKSTAQEEEEKEVGKIKGKYRV